MIVAICGSLLVAATCTSAEPARYKDSLTGQEIPDAWFLEHGLPLDDPKVAFQDPDQDGFTNEDEWREHTDPNDKESRPPYHTKLFLAKFESVPFRLVFKAYDLDPKNPLMEQASLQIDTIDLRQPAEFLKVGDTIPNTRYKLEKFVQKFAPAPGGGQQDVSEVTLVDLITGGKSRLVFNKVADFPDIYAQFVYELRQPKQIGVQTFRVKLSQEFVLRPLVDDQHHYKLLDVNIEEARIQTPTGEIYIVKPDPRRVKDK
jgi:hypothetical protein